MKKFLKILFVFVIIIIAGLILIYLFKQQITAQLFKPTALNVALGVQANNQNLTNTNTANPEKLYEIVAENLNIPWEIAF